MLLNNERINNEIAGETVRYFETNEKENVTRNPRDTVKAALRGGGFAAVTGYEEHIGQTL